MKRKVIKQANSAYTLTLPIRWVRDNGIDESSEVEVSLDGRRLVVANSGPITEKKAVLDANGFDRRNIFRHINAFYANGIDEIEILSEKDISSDVIKLLNSLIGYALVSTNNGKYIVRDIGGVASNELDEIFKRVFQAVILFYEEAINDIFGKQKETQDSLRMRDLEVNKLCLYLQRAINKMAMGTSNKGRIMFAFSYELERIGDDILRLWRTNISSKPPKNKITEKLARDSLTCLEGAFDLYYVFNSRRSETLYDLREKVRKGISSLKRADVLSGQILKVAESAIDLNHLTLMMNLE